MFYNRHYKNDRDFRNKVDTARTLGKETTDDRVVAAFLKKISDGDSRLILYYLEHNVEPYMPKHTVQPAGRFERRLAQPNAFSESQAYEQYIHWSAMTAEERAWYGVETSEQFCKANGVPNVGMLAIWSRRQDFELRVAALREEWVFKKTSDILGDIYAAARRGEPQSQRLWIKYVQDMTKKRDAGNPDRVVTSPEDIRFLIEALPEPLKSKHYDSLRDIIADANAISRAETLKEYQKAGVANEQGEVIPDLPIEPRS